MTSKCQTAVDIPNIKIEDDKKHFGTITTSNQSRSYREHLDIENATS